jgi:hypothetical protein
MNAGNQLRGLLRFRPLQLLALVGLLSLLAGIYCKAKLCVLDADIWWHLRVGDWIVLHRSVPHTGILSYTAFDRSWVAYSWAYEVLLSYTYRWFGLVGVGIFGLVLTLAIAYVVYWMLCRLSHRFWFSTLLAAITCYAFLFNVMPRPVFLSMILFTVVLTLVLEANRSGRLQFLYWLPPLFFLWANIHIQFVYGLFLVGLLAAITLTQYFAAIARIAPSPAFPATGVIAILAACFAATCIGPYSFHLYQVIFEYSRAKFAYQVILELQPIDFRNTRNYVQLLLAAAAFFAVGWQKKIDPFKLALLTIASVVAFRTMRDAFFICIPAAACIADSLAPAEEPYSGETPLEAAGMFAGVALCVFLLASNTDFNSRGLLRTVSSQYPVSAVDFLRRNHLQGPLYNTLDWGGFLTWYLPELPVAIDGRNDLYGDDIDRQFYATQMGSGEYTSDRSLGEARTVLIQRRAPLASNLLNDPRFSLIYQDRIALIFARSN